MLHLLALPVLTLPAPPAAADERPPTRAALRENIVKMTTTDKAAAYRAYFQMVGRAGLADLTTDPDTGIALQAAWEVNKILTKRADPWFGGEEVVYDPGALLKFVGFVETRTGVAVPSWWAGEVVDVRVVPGRHHAFRGRSKYATWETKETRAGGVRVAASAELERSGTDLVTYTAGGRSVRFAVSDYVPVRRGLACTAAFAGDRAVVALHSPKVGAQILVAGFEGRGTEPIWTAMAWGVRPGSVSGGTPLTGSVLGGAENRVELVMTADTVFVFGAESHGAYIEAFDTATGTRRFRFCTCYWFHFSEAWDLEVTAGRADGTDHPRRSIEMPFGVGTGRANPPDRWRSEMRKIKVFAHISLDGVVSPGGPNDDSEYARGGWTAPYRTPAGAAAVAEAQGKNFDLLLGRRTYDLWAGFWPKAPSSPFADGLNAATKYVATYRPEGLDWGPVGDLGADVMEGIRGIKSNAGPDLVVWGSTGLTPALFEHGLVDEVVLIVYPVLLGRGKRFFSDGVDPRELTFVGTKATPTGVLLNTYRYVGPLQT